jgi:hypothetical protein
MATGDEKKYEHNGKTVKIIPLKKVKKMAADKPEKAEKPEKEKKEKTPSASKPRKPKTEVGVAKFAVDDKVALKNIPAEYAAAGFAESVIVKVFKSSYDQTFRYTIRSLTGRELAMVKEEQLKPRKINFTK